MEDIAFPSPPALHTVSDPFDDFGASWIQFTNQTSIRFCNQFLIILRKTSDVLPVFFPKFETHDSIMNHMQEHISREFRTQGFEERALSSISSGIYEVFWEDPTEILKHQVRNMHSSKLLLEPFQSSFYTQPMNAEIGLKAIPAAQSIINNNGNRTIFWKVKHRDGVDSAIGCLKLCSDKSQYQWVLDRWSFTLRTYPCSISPNK